MIKFYTFINPFSGIFETKNYPFARMLRTSFLQKLGDTYCVFAGNPVIPIPVHTHKKDHIGLLDYPTLMIPYGVSAIFAWGYENSKEEGETPLNVAAFLLTTGFSGFFDACRILGAGILTAAVSPIVGIVHLWSKFESHNLYKKVESIPVNSSFTYIDEQSNLKRFQFTFGNFIKKNWLDYYEDIRIDCFGTTKKLTLNFRSVYNKKRVYTTANLDLDKRQDKDAFNALLKLNMGRLSYKLEKNHIYSLLPSSNKNRNELAKKNVEIAIDTRPKPKNA